MSMVLLNDFRFPEFIWLQHIRNYFRLATNTQHNPWSAHAFNCWIGLDSVIDILYMRSTHVTTINNCYTDIIFIMFGVATCEGKSVRDCTIRSHSEMSVETSG